MSCFNELAAVWIKFNDELAWLNVQADCVHLVAYDIKKNMTVEIIYSANNFIHSLVLAGIEIMSGKVACG